VIGQNIPVRFDDINQDIVEHHFGRLRSDAGDTTLVNQNQIRHGERVSNMMRTQGPATKRGNASASSFKQVQDDDE
jgi:hypothetical protein